MFRLHSFRFSNIRCGKVKCISGWNYNRLNQREISIDGNREMVRRPRKILLLEPLWAWSMDDPLTQIPRLSTFWPIAALHRCITRANNELACRPVSMAQVPTSRKVHLSFASCVRDATYVHDRGWGDGGEHTVSFFKGLDRARENTSWLRCHHLLPRRRQEFLLGNVRMKVTSTNPFLSHRHGIIRGGGGESWKSLR